MTTVSVCIATYQRLRGLQNLLDSIEKQDIGAEVDVEILIVDNDPEAAKDFVLTHAQTSRFDVHYFSQPEPNISLTRNVAVAAAAGDLIWFVDDDEIAESDCLRLLIEALHRFNADVVYGPVIPIFETDMPHWMRKLHARPIHPTGTPSQAHRTSNTLVRADALREQPGPFDPQYGVTGGSDGLLFRQLECQGLKLINSAEAKVTEVVPAERSSWKWLQSRMRRMGQNYGRQTVAIEQGLISPGVGWMATKAVIQIGLWSGAAVAHWPNREKRSQYQLRTWTNVGKIEGIFGASTTRDP